MKFKNFIALGLGLILSLCGCSSVRDVTVPTYNGNIEGENTVTIYLELGEGGLYKGESGAKESALYLENCVKYVATPGSELPTKDDVTNVNGDVLLKWEYVPGHGHNETMKTVPNYEACVLYAVYGKEAQGNPDADWFIVGTGSFVTGPTWNPSGGFGMTENPDHPYSDAEYMAIGVHFETGDIWKICSKDTSKWIETGWESQAGSAIANGDMKSVGNEFGGSNIEVITSGYYDIYLKLYNNSDPTVWIQRSSVQ